MSEPIDNASLESQLDSLLSQVESAPAEAETSAPGVSETPRAEPTAEPDAVAEAESALDHTEDLASKLDAMFAEPEAAEVGSYVDPESAVEPEANEPTEPAQPAEPTVVAAVDPEEAEVVDTDDLALKLDAMLSQTVDEPTAVKPEAEPEVEAETVEAERDPEEAGAEVDEVMSEFDGSFESPEIQDPPEVAEAAERSESSGSSEADASATLPESVEPVEDEAALLAEVALDVEAEADAALEEAESGGDFAALADMLGVDAEALAEIPPTPEDDAVATDNQPDAEEAVDIDDALDGAFSSVDDLLAEMDPALAELNADADLIASESAEVEATEASGDPVEASEEDEFDGTFESVDGDVDEPVVAASSPEPEAAAEPVQVGASSVDEELDEFEGGFASVDEVLVDAAPAMSIGDDGGKSDVVEPKAKAPAKAKVDITLPSGRQLAEAAVAASKQAAATGQDVAIRVKPHAIRAAKLSYRGLKLGCFHANGSLDTVGGKLAKEESPPLPLKQYTGIAAMAVLVPGVLLVVIGLLT